MLGFLVDYACRINTRQFGAMLVLAFAWCIWFTTVVKVNAPETRSELRPELCERLYSLRLA